jgi:hypothetical protein
MARIKKAFIPVKPRSCGGKNRYATKREAELVAREQEMRDLRQELRIEVYRCVYCGGWHLTSREKQTR